MVAKTRIYYAEAEGKKYLVDTSSIGQARTAVAKKHIAVRLAKPSEIVALMRERSAEIIQPSDDDQVDVEDLTGTPQPPSAGEPPLEFGKAQGGRK